MPDRGEIPPAIAETIRQSDDHLRSVYESIRVMRAHLDLSRRAVAASRQTIDATKPKPGEES